MLAFIYLYLWNAFLAMKNAMCSLFFFMFISGVITACSPKKENQSVYLDQPTCINLPGHCQVITHKGALQILFNVEKVKVEEEFTITVVPEFATDNTKLSGYLEGTGMYMGVIPVIFNQDENGHFHAKTMLAACSNEVMRWRLRLNLNDDAGKPLQRGEIIDDIYFDFDSHRH